METNFCKNIKFFFDILRAEEKFLVAEICVSDDVLAIFFQSFHFFFRKIFLRLIPYCIDG